MKISEIILEDLTHDEELEYVQNSSAGSEESDDELVTALPDLRSYPELDNSSPYHSYRFGMALAGSPDTPTPKEGKFKQKLVTVSYSKADEEIVKGAIKDMGVRSETMSSSDSKEMSDINTKSPMQPRGPIKRNNQ